MCEMCEALKDNINAKMELVDRLNDDLVVAVMLLKKALPFIKECRTVGSYRIAETIENYLLK